MVNKVNRKVKILLITPASFHNSIMHAGGQSINYYFTQFYNSPLFETSILSLDDQGDDFNKMREQFNQCTIVTSSKTKSIVNKVIDYFLIRYIYKGLKNIIPFYYATNGFYQRKLVSLLDEAVKVIKPDLVLVEYTSVIFFLQKIKTYFPEAKIIAACHDIVFQSVERKLSNRGLKLMRYIFYKSFKTLEINALREADMISVPSEKDKNLLMQNSDIPESDIHVISLFYETYQLKKNKKEGIVFFGYMAREENQLSMIWFLTNVWKSISSQYPELQLFVVGGGVTPEFKELCKEYANVSLTGYVKDPSEYFSRSFAMIAPLKFGAGVKVKSLEAMAAGMVLIANEIGIEGVNAVNQLNYLHAEEPNEWIQSVIKVIGNEALVEQIGLQAKNFIAQSFPLKESFNRYSERMIKLLGN